MSTLHRVELLLDEGWYEFLVKHGINQREADEVFEVLNEEIVRPPRYRVRRCLPHALTGRPAMYDTWWHIEESRDGREYVGHGVCPTWEDAMDYVERARAVWIP